MADALVTAGASEVVAIGGDAVALGELGLRWHPDRHPGEGPLGGILTALSVVPTDVVVVVATDLVALTPATVRAVVDGLAADPRADVALAHTDRLEPLCGAWRRTARPALEHAFTTGERAVHVALTALAVTAVVVDAAALANVNTPADLPRR